MGERLTEAQRRVIHWDLSIRCRTREQAHRIVQRLLREPIDFDFDIEHAAMTDGSQCWTVSINDMPWGNNIKTVGRIVSKEDAES